MTIRFAPDAAREAFTPVDNRYLLDYLTHADGTHVRVSLYGLMQCFHASTAEPAVTEALGLSEPAVIDAFRYWQEQGLVLIRSELPLSVEYRAISGAPALSAPAAAPGQYAGLVCALNSLTAPRRFDLRELRHVYDWVEVYGLDEDTVLELVSHCMAIKGRRVSVNYIGAVAQSWAEQGIRTRADALRYVERYDLKKHGASAILREWNKSRKPTKAEMALYEKWTGEWGFTQEAILRVLPRLLIAGTPNFAYLDERLEQLYRAGSVAPDDISQADAKDAGERAFTRMVFERAGKVEPATKTQRAQIAMYVNDYRMPRELLLFGAEQCKGANEPFGLMKKIWNDWHEHGVDSIEKAAEYQKTRTAEKSGGKRAQRKPNYTQHDLTDEQLNGLLADLDKDL